MEIILENLSKRYNRQWVFKDINLELSKGKAYAVTGPNGSGKSTLLKVMVGSTPPTSGKVYFKRLEKELIDEAVFYKYCSMAAPYIELIEEFTTKELLDFHFKFKGIKNNYSKTDIIKISYLEKHTYKPIKNYSSGMKQRLKLALAFYSDTPVLFLDEPTSNLDDKGIDWYFEQVKKNSDRLIIVASNQFDEYQFCDEHIHVPDYIRQ